LKALFDRTAGYGTSSEMAYKHMMMVMSQEADYLKKHCNGVKDSPGAKPPSIAIPGVLMQTKARKFGRPKKSENDNQNRKSAPARAKSQQSPKSAAKERVSKGGAKKQVQQKGGARLIVSDSLFSFSQND
jgi:hypothetical protein